MGYVKKSPAIGNSSPDRQRQIDANFSRLDRKHIDPAPQVQLVKVEPEPSEHWPPGTAWLDTSGE